MLFPLINPNQTRREGALIEGFNRIISTEDERDVLDIASKEGKHQNEREREEGDLMQILFDLSKTVLTYS